MKVSIPWPDACLSPNSRSHWRVKAKAAKAARSAAFFWCHRAMAEEANPPLGDLMRPRVELRFYRATNRRMDVDNAIARCKNLLDGIADALKVDDSRFILSAMMMDPEKPARVEVHIT